MYLALILFFVGLVIGFLVEANDSDAEGVGCGLAIIMAIVGLFISLIFTPPAIRELRPIDTKLHNMSDVVRSQGGYFQSSTDTDYIIFESIDPKTGALNPQKIKKYNNSVNIFLDSPEVPYMRTYEVVFTPTSQWDWLLSFPRYESVATKEFHVPENTVDKVFLIH